MSKLYLHAWIVVLLIWAPLKRNMHITTKLTSSSRKSRSFSIYIMFLRHAIINNNKNFYFKALHDFKVTTKFFISFHFPLHFGFTCKTVLLIMFFKNIIFCYHQSIGPWVKDVFMKLEIICTSAIFLIIEFQRINWYIWIEIVFQYYNFQLLCNCNTL